jgi:hydrogenase maturation protease
MKKILIYGYGNPGRQDDGLANELVELVQSWAQLQGLENIDCDSNYQLNIEDGETISHYDIVIFADASIEAIEDFYWSKIDPSDSKVEFSMHAVSPAYVLDLCQKIYKQFPEAFLLHIKGYEWEFMGEITTQARLNLEKAFDFLKNYLTVLQKQE